MKNSGLVLVIVFAVAIAGILAGVWWFVTPSVPVLPIRENDDTPIGRVEGKTVTKFHLKVLRETERIKTDGKPMEDYGYLLQLMDLLVMEEILKRNGIVTSPDELAFERARIDRETREPEKLRLIKEYAAQFPGMYEMVMIRNNYLVNNKIHRFQQMDRKIQATAYRTAQEILQEAKASPGTLKNLERQPEVRFMKADTRDEAPKHPEPGVAPPVPKPMAMEFAGKHLKNVKAGELCPEVIDIEVCLVIAKLLEQGPDFVAYETLIVQKAMFDTWYKEELRTLDMEILDPAFRDILQQKARGNIIVDRMYPPPASK